MNPPNEGWGGPAAQTKFHYFRGARSLCGKWGYTGALYPDGKSTHPDDCTQCSKLRRKERPTDHGQLTSTVS